MESFRLIFSETERGPLCRNVSILDDDIYEFEESLTFNLTTGDAAGNLDPASGVMVIQDEDSEFVSL